MAPTVPSPQVSDWLAQHGWFPGRDIGDEEVDDFISVRVRDATEQGFPMEPVDAAVRVIRTYGGLKLAHPRASDSAFEMDPTGGYDGDAREIAEMSTGLGEKLFPVGFESSEFGILLVGETARWFLLHHTGGYFLGQDEQDAFTRFITNGDTPDVEDYFV
ncbi:SUKH-3 domain-containing protein [Streptomyces olivaceiscleroticus]|uniref:SUKH-3 domain containing protein n=1 Tax=Streptomyces olivaceiscleroticus TaxID=68245 RepID=A0ABN1AA23_9ACTN